MTKPPDGASPSAVTPATRFTCPVCYWPDLTTEPLDMSYNICPCCGTEFGYDDFTLTHAQLRERWIDGGCVFWSSDQDRKPVNWNGVRQLLKGLAEAAAVPPTARKG